MRIGLVIYGHLEIVTGGFLYDRMLVNHVRSRGDDVVVFALPWRTYPRHLGDNFFSGLARKLESANLDVLLQDELNHPSLFLLNRRLRGRVRYPIVSIVHHLRCSELRPAWQNTLYRWVEKHYLDSVDGFIFNSQTTRRAVAEVLGGVKQWVVACPGGDLLKPSVKPEDARRRALEPGPLRVLFVGSLIPRKQLHTLIEALVQVPRDLWRLDVVGCLTSDTTYTRRIQAAIDEHGIGGQVSFLGTLTGDEMARRWAASHVLAVPSSYEGFGIVYLEGMGFGLPAIASTAGAAHEIITSGRDGFLVPTGDARKIAMHIRDLATDRQKLAQMAAAAVLHFREHPTWQESMASVAAFLDEMVR
ncbi:MAG: glycosyltransferase family 4 protein [Desulfomonile sp.]|nr:glycosyltransferase family 4 protein [Desulfomonile sp.]